MSDMPLVSVIIAAYNAQAFIQECLDSIIAQTYKRIEIIAVDDGSTDNTAKIIKEYPQVRYIYQKPSGGPAVPRNNGISQSSGEYICFFDDDDIMVEDRIEKQVYFMENHPEIGVSFCNYRNFDTNGEDEQTHFQTCPELSSIIENKNNSIVSNACVILAKENFGICGTLMLRRNMLNYENGFDLNLKGPDDFHFYYRLARHSQVGIINEVGQMRRLHAGNLSGNQYMMQTMMIRCREKLQETETDPKAKLLLGKYISGCWSNLSRYEANKRHYFLSLKREIQALANDFCISRLLKSLYSFTRTIMIAIGANHPDE